jgi:hypothetical protein
VMAHSGAFAENAAHSLAPSNAANQLPAQIGAL